MPILSCGFPQGWAWTSWIPWAWWWHRWPRAARATGTADWREGRCYSPSTAVPWSRQNHGLWARFWEMWTSLPPMSCKNATEFSIFWLKKDVSDIVLFKLCPENTWFCHTFHQQLFSSTCRTTDYRLCFDKCWQLRLMSCKGLTTRTIFPLEKKSRKWFFFIPKGRNNFLSGSDWKKVV